jgi:hypothetical protein
MDEFQSIDSVLESYDSARRCDPGPRIEDYLPLASAEQRGELWQLLAGIEAAERLSETHLCDASSSLSVAPSESVCPERFPHSPLAKVTLKAFINGASSCSYSADGNAISLVDKKLADEIDHDSQPGTMIHERYLLASILGEGGMGRVQLAHDQLLDRLVAMKVVAVRIQQVQAAYQEALAREARLGASLNDAGIAAVYDFGIHAGKSFTIFEYIDGETLRHLLKRCHQLQLSDVQRIVSSLARSLDFAHSRGVIHRDLKPENICITKQGHPKILDFGIARDLRIDFQLEGFCGTPQYAAPEQVACSATDGRTDQYTLALLAWEMLAGRRVFEADNVSEFLRLHRQMEPEIC